MSCTLCSSSQQTEFAAEVNIHLPGLTNTDKPGILVFPKLLICLNCGSSRFTTPASELTVLATVVPTAESSTRPAGRVAPHYPVGL